MWSLRFSICCPFRPSTAAECSPGCCRHASVPACKKLNRSACPSCSDCPLSACSDGCSIRPSTSSGGSSMPCSGPRHERAHTKSPGSVRHAAHGAIASGQLPRSSQELDRTAVPVRMLFLHRRLACVDHGGRGHLQARTACLEHGHRLAGGGAESRACHA